MNPKRILLIDDDLSILTVVQVCLESLRNWQVSTASSATETMTQIHNEPPDAILLDLMMPDIDGLALLKQLRKEKATQTTPVILLTAKIDQLRSSSKYSQLDVAGLIGKPFDTLKLPEQIEQILDWEEVNN